MKIKMIGLMVGVALSCIAQVTQAQKICANISTGDFNTRNKCKANELPVSAGNLMSVIQGRTTYLSSCRTVEATDYAPDGTAGAAIRCNEKEFLLNYGDYVDPFRLTVVRWNEMDYDGNIPVGVHIISQIDFGVPSSLPNNFTLYVTGTCCPRI